MLSPQSTPSGFLVHVHALRVPGSLACRSPAPFARRSSVPRPPSTIPTSGGTPSESGWGVNFVQSDNFIFATFFIYGPNNQPIWYTAQHDAAMPTACGRARSTAPPERTSAIHGAPRSITHAQVGTVTFTPTNVVQRDAHLQRRHRQRRQADHAADADRPSRSAATTRAPCCRSSATATIRPTTGRSTYFANLTVDADRPAARCSSTSRDSDGPFTMVGTYIQDGQLYRIPNAAYTLRHLHVHGASTRSRRRRRASKDAGARRSAQLSGLHRERLSSRSCSSTDGRSAAAPAHELEQHDRRRRRRIERFHAAWHRDRDAHVGAVEPAPATARRLRCRWRRPSGSRSGAS